MALRVKCLNGRVCGCPTYRTLEPGRVLSAIVYLGSMESKVNLDSLTRFMNAPTLVIVHSVAQNLAVIKHLQQVMVGRRMFALILVRSLINVLRIHVARASRHQVIFKSMFALTQVNLFWGFVQKL
jgi:hypothetical protein